MTSTASAFTINTDPSLFRVKSAWSKAGVGTSIVLETQSEDSPGSGGGGKPTASTRIVFDIGSTPCIADAFPAKTVFITHGHIDHFGGMFSHARAQVAYGGSTPTYYVPLVIVDKLEEARQAFSTIDAMNDGSEGSRSESLLKMNIVGVEAGDEIELKLKKIPDGKKLFLRAFSVSHCGHPALGYVIVSRRRPGLKPEYRGLSNDKIRDLVQSGVQIKGDSIEVAEVMYTGDSSVDGLLKREDASESCSDRYLNQAFTAPLILCEATYLDKDMQGDAKRRGHMSIEDIPTVLKSHGWHDAPTKERKLILFHLSARHKPAKNALELIIKHLPTSIANHCDVAISSLCYEGELRHDLNSDGCISLKNHGDQKTKRIKTKPFAPRVNAVERGIVTRLEPYGAFVQLQSYRARGLVHKNQMSRQVELNDEVLVRVIDVTKDRDERTGKIWHKVSLSMTGIVQDDKQ